MIGEVIEEMAMRQTGMLIDPFPRKVPYIMKVTAIGPACKELQVGDIAILPSGGGATVRVIDEDTGEEDKVFLIREEDVLGFWREEE